MRLRRPLALAIVTVTATACGGGGENPASPRPSASSLTISPSSATVTALEDTTDFSATVRDANGNAISDATISWSSTDGTTVSVNSNGESVAQANGMAEIVATSSGLADSASVTVDQQASQVSVSPGADTLATGESVQLSASATDANGNAISNADFTWTSSNTSVATVDSTGLVQAKTDGSVDIAAELDGVTNTSSLTVELGSGSGSPPTINSVSPSPLPEGGSVTISGSNFATASASNTVLVDGVEATVVSATSTSLDIDVPLYDCLPARDVGLEVTTSGGTGSATFPLSPDEAAIQISTGEQFRVQNPEDFCFQFKASSNSTAYLLGVQSVTEAATSLTPASVVSVTGGTSAVQQAVSLSHQVEERLNTGGRALTRDPRHQAHTDAKLELMQSARERLGGRATSSLPYQQAHGFEALSATVPGTVSVGDSVDLNIASTDNICQVAATITAEIRHVGTQGIWLTDVDNPSGGYTDSDIQQLADQFDNLAYPTDTLHFGSPPDTDSNGKVVLVISQEINRQGGVLGFVSPGDYFSPSTCAASNEGEFTYLVTPDPNGTVGPAFTTSFLLEDQPRTIAHEFVHMIQTGRRFIAGNDFLDVWLAEGQAVFGEEIVGHEVTGQTSGANLGFTTATFGTSSGGATPWYWNGFIDLSDYFGFETNSSKVPGAPEECGWLARNWAGGPCIGSRSVYGTPWSLLRWATDHFGPAHAGGKAGFQRDLIGRSENGFELLEALTGAPIEEMLAQWAAGLYVDDRIIVSDPLLTQPSWDYFNIYQNLVESARLLPLDAPFGNFEATGSIRAGSSGYIRLSDSTRPATAIRVRTQTDTTLPPEMQVWVVRLQ